MAANLVVAHLLEKLVVGGAENLAVRLANARAARGDPTCLFCLQGDGELSRRVEAGVCRHELEIHRESVRRPHAFAARVFDGRRVLRQQLRRQGVRVVQSHLPEANFWSLLLSGRGDPAVIATVHNNDEFHYPQERGRARRALRRQAYRLILRRAGGVVAVSTAVRDSLAVELNLSDRQADRITVVPNGVRVPPVDPLARQAVRTEFAIPADATLLVGVGRLTEQKNFLALVELAGGLRDRGRTIRVLVAGDGEQRDLLQRRIDALDLGAAVTLLGLRDDVDRLLQAADLFVLSSRWEGLPLVLLEAMAAGCPAAGFAIAGTRELVRDGEHGVLVPLDDVAGLIERVDALLDDPDRLTEMGARARALVREHHDLDRAVDALEELYERVVGARSGDGIG